MNPNLPPPIDLRPPHLRWALLAGHILSPRPIVSRRTRAAARDRLAAALVLVVLAAVGAVLGIWMPL